MKKILVRAPNWIGDAVMSLPALAALGRSFSRARISVLAKSRVIPVYQNQKEVSEVIEYDSAGIHRGLKGRLKLAAEIKKRGFDTAVLFQNAFDAAFLSFVARIPNRIGYARDMRTPLLTRAITATREIRSVHQIFYYLRLVEVVGATHGANTMPEINLSTEEKRWADGFFKDATGDAAGLVCAAPGANYGIAKMWPAPSFAKALDKLCKKMSLKPVLLGGPDDSAVCADIANMMEVKPANLSGELALRQSMAIAARSALFITNDSGMMHVAAALGAPTVAVFGSTDPNLTGPIGKKTAVVIKKTPCSPCFERTCRFGHYDCLTKISADDVVQTAILLSGGK